MPDGVGFYYNHKLVEQIKMWECHYESMGLASLKIMTLIERRCRNGKIYSNPKS